MTAFSAAQLGPGKPGSTGFRSNKRSAPGVHPDDFGRGAPVGLAEQRAFAPNPWLVQRSETKARASCAVPRTSSVRPGTLRAVAGRIIKNAAFRNSQWSATATAAANIVVMTSVANCSMAIMAFLPVLRFGEPHGDNQFQPVDKKGLTGVEVLNCRGDKYTPCRRGRATPQASFVRRTVYTNGQITNLELRDTSHSESNANIRIALRRKSSF